MRMADDKFLFLRLESISTINCAKVMPRTFANSRSAFQNGSSNDTDVRWPAMVTERLSIFSNRHCRA